MLAGAAKIALRLNRAGQVVPRDQSIRMPVTHSSAHRRYDGAVFSQANRYFRVGPHTLRGGLPNVGTVSSLQSTHLDDRSIPGEPAM